MIKKRSKESYYGNTAEARKMQRSNLIPGGKDERRKIQGASKISIYKKAMSGLTKESRSEIFKDMEECLKKKLEKGI